LRARDAFILNLEHSVFTPVAPFYLQLRRIVQQATDSPDLIQDPGWLLPRLTDLSDRFEVYLRRLDYICDLAFAISGGQPQVAEWVDLASVVRDAAARVERELAAAHIDLTVGGSRDAVLGRWDRCRLEGLCAHLLSSSIKFGAGKPMALSVRGDDTHAHLTVFAPRHDLIEVDPDRIFEELGKREAAAGSLNSGLWAVRPGPWAGPWLRGASPTWGRPSPSPCPATMSSPPWTVKPGD
jgi:hypothetical protein